MMLWISSISGSPASSIPTSLSTGMRRSPNASNCSRESQISLTRKLPFDLKATWYSSPCGGQSPTFSRRRIVSSYCSVVTLDTGAKRARTLVLRASMVADGTVVAIGGLLRVDAAGRADLQPNASCCARLASEDSAPGSTTQRITSLARLRNVPLHQARFLAGGHSFRLREVGPFEESPAWRAKALPSKWE